METYSAEQAEQMDGVMALQVLQRFARRQCQLKDEEAMDALFDLVIEVLERARDERWRLRTGT